MGEICDESDVTFEGDYLKTNSSTPHQYINTAAYDFVGNSESIRSIPDHKRQYSFDADVSLCNFTLG